MKSVFWHLGDKEPDYRSLMKHQQDFVLEGKSIPVARLVICEQTHSNLIHHCREEDCGAGLANHPQIAVADGFVRVVKGEKIQISDNGKLMVKLP